MSLSIFILILIFIDCVYIYKFTFIQFQFIMCYSVVPDDNFICCSLLYGGNRVTEQVKKKQGLTNQLEKRLLCLAITI